MRTSSSLLVLAATTASLLGSAASTVHAEAEHAVVTPVVVGVGPQVHYRRRPGPRFMMPLKIDLGAAGVDTSRGFAPGINAAVGIHWASLSPNPTQTDVGIGVFGALLGAPSDPNNMSNSNGIAYGGAYLEGAHTLSHGQAWRTWAAVRGEYIGSSAFGVDHTGFGVTGRLSTELYASGVGIEPRGLFLGTYAVGLYVEAGVRDMVADVGDFHIGAGLTFRTPFVVSP